MTLSPSSIARRLRFHHLELLREIADQGTLTAAASQLHISIAAVSKSLADIEGILGQTLFDRSARGLRPTADGLRVLTHVRLLLAEFQHMVNSLGTDGTPQNHSLRLGMPPFLAQELSPGLIAQLQRRASADTVYQITEGWLTQLVEGLLAGELDAVFALYSEHAVTGLDLSRLTLDILRSEPMLVVAPPVFGLTDNAALDWPDVAALPWVMPPSTTHTRRTIAEAFATADCPLPTPRVECPSLTTSVHLAAAGIGMAVVPVSAARAFLANGSLIALRALSLPDTRLVLMHRPVSLLYRPGLTALREAVLERYGPDVGT